MVSDTTAAAAFTPLTQNTAKATTNPAVQFLEDVPVTVTKVGEPTLQLSTQLATRGQQAAPVLPLGVLADRVFELLQAFRAGQAKLATERIAQEIKAFGAGVHDLRLDCVYVQETLLPTPCGRWGRCGT